MAWAADAGSYRLLPRAVVFAGSVAEVQALFRFSRRAGVPMTIRADGNLHFVVIPAIGDQTPEDLVREGRAEAVKACLSRIAVGGYAGLVVSSFAAGAKAADRKAVFWHWAPDPPHQVRVIDPGGRLPRNDLSWQ